VDYVSIGPVKMNAAKLDAAKKAQNPFKMGRKLLPEFFTDQELSQCSCVPSKSRPQVNEV
jgi:hypothetical protein